VNLSPGLNAWTAHVLMTIYNEIHRRFVYKAKEGHVITLLMQGKATS